MSQSAVFVKKDWNLNINHGSKKFLTNINLVKKGMLKSKYWIIKANSKRSEQKEN